MPSKPTMSKSSQSFSSTNFAPSSSFNGHDLDGDDEVLHRLRLVHVKFFGREEEQRLLRDTLNETISLRTKRVLLLEGLSGTGKTRLVDNFRLMYLQRRRRYEASTMGGEESDEAHKQQRPTAADDGRVLFISCCGNDAAFTDFASTPRQHQPAILTLKHAFRELVDTLATWSMASHGDLPVITNLQKALHEQLSAEDRAVLFKVLPGLLELIMTDDSAQTYRVSNGDATGFQQHSRRVFNKSITKVSQPQWNHLFGVLVRTITQTTPLVLFCDDLHLLDPTSLKVLLSLVGANNPILQTTQQQQFLLLTAYDTKQHTEVSHVSHAITKLKQLQTGNEEEEEEEETRQESQGTQDSSLSGNTKTVGVVKLGNFTFTEMSIFLARVLEQELGLESDATQFTGAVALLARVVYDRTHGSPAAVLSYLQMLERRGMLKYNYRTQRWNWSDPQRMITDTLPTDNVVDAIIAKFTSSAQPQTMNQILKIASCLSPTIHTPILTQLVLQQSEQDRPTDPLDVNAVQSLLQQAQEEGLFVPLGGDSENLRFAHDRIQQAAYGLFVDPSERERLHYTIGRIFLKIASNPSKASSSGAGNQYPHVPRMVAVDQLHKGRAFLPEDHAFVTEVASLNLEAGKMAMSAGAYPPAARFLQNGIDTLLEDRNGGGSQTEDEQESAQIERWHKTTDPQRRRMLIVLHQNLAEAMCFMGDPRRAGVLTRRVLHHARTDLEQFAARATLAQALGDLGKYREAVELEVEELQSMGLIPKNINKRAQTTSSTAASIIPKKLLKKLTKLRPNEVLSFPICQDEKIIVAVRFLNLLLEHSIVLGYETLQTIAPVATLQLVMDHGIHPTSVSCFAQVGVLMSSSIVAGDAVGGNRLGELSLAWERKFAIPSVSSGMSTTSFLLSCYLRPWCLPLQDTIKPLVNAYNEKGAKLPQRSGKPASTCYAYALIHKFLVGEEALGNLLNETRDLLKSIDKSSSTLLRIFCQTQCNLVGQAKDPTVLRGEAMDERVFVHEVSSQSGSGMYHLHLWKMQTLYLFGQFQEAQERYDKADALRKVGLSFAESYMMTFYSALIPLTLALETGLDKHRRRAKGALAAVKKASLNEGKNAPLRHKLVLLDATALAALQKRNGGNKKHIQAVRSAFDQAIDTCFDGGYLADAALGNVLAGMYFLKRKDNTSAGMYLSEAIKIYRKWGAQGVAKHLEELYDYLEDVAALSKRKFGSSTRTASTTSFQASKFYK